ncbi:uncharacterized protein LOC134655293 [Cydia amplana]|uniref:uncharacterized protein LOC134655293 n=1 Tax=Cydia amplana TaxID=1869771 RepID=UPI002FE64FBD
MSGKSYSLREMKSIVDYLTVNRLYGETKGRKMWMEFANSNLTQRTWQSLKETFLKRILPDITNPYYRLDPEQILSFKRGMNLTQKDRRLELRPVNTSKNNGANDENDQPSTSKKNTEEYATGEDIQCSKIVHNRASTETLILDTCYQTAEDMQSDLESANEDQNEDKTKKPALKSVRDFIEYTEPLTPMLQEVLDDFDEDCSDAEPPMQIDENYVAQDETSDTPENPTSSQSILKPNKTQNTAKITTAGEKVNEKQAGNINHTKNNTEEPVVVPDDTAFSQLEDVMVLVDEALAQDIDKELSRNIESQNKEASSNQSIPMTDSLLPNNQEAIKNTTLEVPSPTSSTHDKGEEGNRKKESEIDDKKSNSQSNLLSDQEPEQKGSDGLITIDSNEEKANNKDTAKENHTAISPKSPEKPALKDDKVHEIHSDSSTGHKDVDPQVDNPCLKSVSLFEQLSTPKYSDSDSNNKENAKEQRKTQAQIAAETKKNKDPMSDGTKVNEDQNNEKANSKKQTQDGVILLNSRTTSESVDDSDIHHRPLARSSLKIQKDKKLASVFGFSNGGAPKNRRLNGRKRTTSHRKVQSDSSDWTSTSDSEYVSPPHGRRNRYARKYLKPRAARIMSLEEEGGLFVMLGKKVYPLVKDGKLVKNYVTFLPESDPEEDDSYWKSKYIEERKRTDVLKKKLGHSKSNGVLEKEEKDSSISISSVTSPLTENRTRLPPSRRESVQGNELMRRYSGVMEKPANKETLKIKFTKNDQEVQLEGHWQHINPVLAQVVSILHKDAEKKADTVTCVELSSGNTTPITPTVVPAEAPMDTGKYFKEVQLEGHWQHINPVLAQVVSILHKDAEKKADTVTCVELSSGNTTPITPTVVPAEVPMDTVVSILHKDAEKKADTVTCVELSSGNTTPITPTVVPAEVPMDTVVSILHKDAEKKADTVTCVELSSGNTTPITPTVVPAEVPMDTVVSILHKDAEKKADTVTCVELSSGNTTPITPTVVPAEAPMDTVKAVQLKGHWQHINPVLAQVVSILHKDAEKKADTVTCVELSSGNTTPITPTVLPAEAPMDTGVRDKVDELESAIFKEIEEKDQKDDEIHEVVEQKADKEKSVPADNTEVKDTVPENVEGQANITQRRKRGRPKRQASPAIVVAQSPAKKPKKSLELRKVVEEVAQDVSNTTKNSGRQTRSPRKLLNGVAPKAKASRKTLAKAQPEAPVESAPNPVIDENEDEVRYKFPSPEPEQHTTKATNTNKNSPKKHLPNTASPESLSHHSANSSQGYQDSDTSPFNMNFRRKRRLSISTLSIKGRKLKRKQRSRSYPLIKHAFSDSDSSYSIAFKTARKEQSTINSEVYKSDSYQLLLPRSRTIEILDKIEEVNDHETDSLANEIRKLRDEILKANDSVIKTDPASSSTLSLPLSPELSFVENLLVSRSAIAEINDHPTINETESNTAQNTCNNKYIMSEVDVSMPLMNQDCELQENYRKHLMTAMSNLSDGPNSAGRNLSKDSSSRMSITSESILKTYSGVNVESSDSLDRRLEQLLLESAQKPANKEEKMEVDTQVKKKGSRKRCSTPHKKNTVQNKKKINLEPVIVEESKANCSRGGRRSCPPSVNLVYCENNVPDNLEINIHDQRIDVTAVTKKQRIKKDIIKVKITKPKAKSQKKKKSPQKKQNSRSSNTEGENESGVFLHGFEDSSELIHNHSETCLHIADCMDPDGSNSVEFIDTTSKSIISLTSGSFASEDKENLGGNSMESGNTTPELYCDNAQCATNLRDARATEVQSADSGNTMYFTPFASRCNSALTEDLSHPPVPKPRTSKWYLLSEDESNTNYFDVQDDRPVYGANLQQIFPITCAIPDLSTITEMSEKSQKASLDATEFRRETK